MKQRSKQEDDVCVEVEGKSNNGWLRSQSGQNHMT